MGGGAVGRVGWGGVQVGRFGVVRGGGGAGEVNRRRLATHPLPQGTVAKRPPTLPQMALQEQGKEKHCGRGGRGGRGEAVIMQPERQRGQMGTWPLPRRFHTGTTRFGPPLGAFLGISFWSNNVQLPAVGR